LTKQKAQTTLLDLKHIKFTCFESLL
jgi:hypothetical protein